MSQSKLRPPKAYEPDGAKWPWPMQKAKLNLPDQGKPVRGAVLFDWDPPKKAPPSSNITYTLRIATDKGFKDVKHTFQGLGQSEFILPYEDVKNLTSATKYYWSLQIHEYNPRYGLRDSATKESSFQLAVIDQATTGTVIGYISQVQEANMAWIELNESGVSMQRQDNNNESTEYNQGPVCFEDDPPYCFMVVITPQGTNVEMRRKATHLKSKDTTFNLGAEPVTISEPLELKKNVQMKIVYATGVQELHPNHNGQPPPGDLDDVITVNLLENGNPSPNFDLEEINVAKMKLGPMGAPEENMTVEYVGTSGNPDAQLQFLVSDTGLTCEDNEISLVGETNTGGPIKATTSIVANCEAECHDPYEY